MKATLEFKAIIAINGVNPYVLVSSEQANILQANWRKPLPVLVQINSQPEQPWRINMMPVGDGNFYLYLHNDVRRASNTKVGDQISVKLWSDADYKNGPMHPMPLLLQQGLAANKIANNNWSRLSPSRQKEVLRYLAALKSDDALERNVSRALRVLAGEPERFIGRDWRDGV